MKILPDILDRHGVKLHQLTPNSFIQLSKFFFATRTCSGRADVDGFVRFFELHIQKQKVQYEGNSTVYENHFGCATFATRRKNSKKQIERVELSQAHKNKWDDDWLSYWFYVKVDMPRGSHFIQQ